MTGYQSKKEAASAKTIDEVNWADHEPDGRRAAAQDKLDSMEREALKLALEALQFDGNIWHMDCKKDEAITAIKEALAQPEQEPWPEEPFGHMAGGVQPAQRPWVDLTRDDILDLFDEHNVYGSKWIEFARAVLTKSKELNA